MVCKNCGHGEQRHGYAYMTKNNWYCIGTKKSGNECECKEFEAIPEEVYKKEKNKRS